MKNKQENAVLDPLIQTIEVPCPQENAFRAFVYETGSWWMPG
jgi:hypothetical protein